MTGSAPPLDRPALWAALSHIRIDPPAGSPGFESKLAADHGWSLRHAERVADEYRRFLYLAVTAGFEVTPSWAVDQAWHLHLSWPHYCETLCGRILGRPLEHRPGTGEPEDEARCQYQYERTIDLYERVFGGPPPLDIWPRPVTEGERSAAAWRRRSWAGGIATISLAGMAGAWMIGSELAAALFVGGGLLILMFLEPPRPSARRAVEAGCGTFAPPGPACGASCGSGCGGGCGGG